METQHNHLESLYPEDSRYPEIEKILEFVKRGDSCQAIAMPGVGRGNLLKFLAYNRTIRIKHLGEKQSQYHFVYVNFDEIKHRPVIDALKFIFLELASSLHERKLDEAFVMTDRIFKESLQYHDELVLFQGLKEAIDFLTADMNLHIVLLFERFENYLPKLTQDFFTYLRSLRNKAKYKFSVVFSVTRPLEDTIESGILADFYEFFAGHEIYLSLSDNPGIRFRITYLEDLTGKELGKDLIERLLKLTSEHGKLTRLSVETLLASSVQPGYQTVPGVQRLTSSEELEKFLLSQKTIQTALKELQDFLTPAEQQCVRTLTSHSEIDCSIFLEKVGLVKKGKITIPLFHEFILRDQQNNPIREMPLSYDASTNVIKKGNMLISDKLTSSEFRLLRFLIENSHKILERDDIISAVWKDTASTLGVTDQALDQLIFRLRKKIEDNPNDPKHIQTVKGRGISFVA